MRILIVNKYYHPIIGGVETGIKEISERFVKYGHEVVVVSLHKGKITEENINGVKVIRFPLGNIFKAGLNLGMLFYVNRIHREKKFDVISLQNYPVPLSMEFMFFSKIQGIPFLFTPHYHGKGQNWIRDGGLKIYKIIGKIALESSKKVIVNSEFEKELITRDFPDVENKIVLISPGVKEYLPIKHEKDFNSILYVGRVEKYKGLDHVIKALKVLREQHLNVKLIIIGDGQYKQELNDLAIENNVQDLLDWKGKVSESSLGDEYYKAGLLVLLSDAEAYGLVVAEALMCGTPVIVTKSQALVEFVNEPGCFGIDSPPDEKELANLIRKIVESKGAFNVGPFSSKISTWDQTARKYLELMSS